MEELLKDIYEKYKELYANSNDLAGVLTRRTSRTIIPEFMPHQSLSFKERERKSRLDALNEMFKNQKTQITTAPPVVNLPKSKWEIDLSTPGGTVVTTPVTPITVLKAPSNPQLTATTISTPTEVKREEITTEPTTKEERKKLLFQKYMQYGASVDFARLLISQDLLEQPKFNPLGKFNYGNLTVGGYRKGAWKGASTTGRDRDGKGKAIRLQFREYGSIDEYVQDKLSFLRDLYGITGNESIDEFANKLKGANKGNRHYAESSSYKTKLKNVYNGNKNYTA